MMVRSNFLDNGKYLKDFLDTKFRQKVRRTLVQAKEDDKLLGDTLECPQIMQWIIKEFDLRKRLNGIYFIYLFTR